MFSMCLNVWPIASMHVCVDMVIFMLLCADTLYPPGSVVNHTKYFCSIEIILTCLWFYAHYVCVCSGVRKHGMAIC
uniref:Uncharacterized protein n=1 Tax=Arundo donax TaxID=35708 RepID=A0A0A9AZ99_ARUDO